MRKFVNRWPPTEGLSLLYFPATQQGGQWGTRGMSLSGGTPLCCSAFSQAKRWVSRGLGSTQPGIHRQRTWLGKPPVRQRQTLESTERAQSFLRASGAFIQVQPLQPGEGAPCPGPRRACPRCSEWGVDIASRHLCSLGHIHSGTYFVTGSPS